MSEQTTDTALALRPQSEVQLGTLRADSATELVGRAASVATALASVIKSQNLSNTISGRSFVKCEGWTTLGAMLGVTPHEVSVTEQDGVFIATVELRRMADGQSIARASAECGAPDELDRYGKPLWANRPRYARRSMALTRATSKACRLAFSWIMVLAGYDATPAEEMESVIDVEPVRQSAPTPQRQAPAPAPSGAVVRFGKMKGTPLSELTEQALQRDLDWCNSQANPGPQVQSAKREIEGELQRRAVMPPVTHTVVGAPDDDEIPF